VRLHRRRRPGEHSRTDRRRYGDPVIRAGGVPVNRAYGNGERGPHPDEHPHRQTQWSNAHTRTDFGADGDTVTHRSAYGCPDADCETNFVPDGRPGNVRLLHALERWRCV
jgi:hypothetical protein